MIERIQKLTATIILLAVPACFAIVLTAPHAPAAAVPNAPSVGMVVNYVPAYNPNIVQPAIVMRVAPDGSCDLLAFTLYRPTSTGECSAPTCPQEAVQTIVESARHDEYRTAETWHYVNRQLADTNWPETR